MSGFSSRNIDDIKNLYESVVEEDATDVDEGFWRDRGADLRNASSNVANAVTSSADAVVQGVQGKSIPADRRRIAKITNAAVRGTRDAILDFGQGLNTGKSTPKEELSLDGNLIAEAPAEGSSKVVNGKTYYWNGSRYVDASGNQPPASATPAPPKPQPTYAERTRAEREALQVVRGGQSGFKSLMPKPVQNSAKGETTAAFNARMDRYNKSQQLAKNLTRQAQIKAEKERLKGVGNPPDTAPKPDQKSPPSKPDSEPPTAKPKPTPKPPTPAPTPFGKSVSAPSAASLDKYKINKDWAAANPRLAQAQVARASGQPRADINKILYKPGTAAYGASGESEMERQAKELKDKREEIAKQREADKIGPRAQSALPRGAYSPTATANMTQRTRNILGVKEQHDAYDLVLEYLLSEGQVDTVDEANYVMLQMSAEHIQNIVEVSGELFRGIFNPNNSAASKVQKTSPFNRPVTPLPSIVSPFAKPASRDDSGKLTPYGAGGGAAAEKEGKSRAEVMKQGAKNLENKKLKPVNQGPDFGR